MSDTIEALNARIAELEALVDALRRKCNTLQEKVEDDEDDDPAEEARERPETSLEQVASLPDEVAEETLTANQQRARAVLREGLGDKTPKGRRLKSSTVRDFLVGWDGTRHTETVKRVLDIIVDLSDRARDHIREGERRVTIPHLNVVIGRGG